jgi:hypothetical protein
MVINRSIFHLSCEIFDKCVNVCFSGKEGNKNCEQVGEAKERVG